METMLKPTVRWAPGTCWTSCWTSRGSRWHWRTPWSSLTNTRWTRQVGSNHETWLTWLWSTQRLWSLSFSSGLQQNRRSTWPKMASWCTCTMERDPSLTQSTRGCTRTWASPSTTITSPPHTTRTWWRTSWKDPAAQKPTSSNYYYTKQCQIKILSKGRQRMEKN